MFQAERQKRICDIINEKKSVKVSELSQLLGTSEVTVRKDLDELSARKMIVRTHGGAVAMYSVAEAVSVSELIRSNKNIEAKRKIAELAYDNIRDNETIFLDGSSTVHELANLIAKGGIKNLQIITTSLLNVAALGEKENVKVIMLAGEVNYRHQNVLSHLTVSLINSMRVDKCFIGINGIDAEFGFSSPDFLESEIKASMLHSSMKSFILADDSKFGKTFLAKVDAECDCIITSKRIHGFDYDKLDTEVMFADEIEKF
ncbi:MAG: DeoR/GlpR family DNA-binding transcription regulator [Blautia sp.]|jgi:DeoR family fructose operon transcriptional repressor